MTVGQGAEACAGFAAERGGKRRQRRNICRKRGIGAADRSPSPFRLCSGARRRHGRVPVVDPPSTDNFWGVNRSADPTRLGGLRYNASSQSISEGITNALAFANREGAAPDLLIMDFVSYATLVNELGAKVQYVMLNESRAA